MKTKLALRQIVWVNLIALAGCTLVQAVPPINPSEEYTRDLKTNTPPQVPHAGVAAIAQGAKAQLRLVGTENNEEQQANSNALQDGDIPLDKIEGVSAVRSRAALTRDYQGPLDLGDPGIQSSLWRESRGANDMLRDDRAWQSGDLITIAVTENDQGLRQAQTNTKSETTLGAALTNFFGIAEIFDSKRKSVDGSNLISGTSSEEFKGQGTTNRTNQLKGRISVMVAEVLPTGILRIEGKKIVSVNDEEQIMILSGLVRVRDISSINEVDSSKVANMRIDYYGKGTLDEAQTPGWGTRLVGMIWPF